MVVIIKFVSEENPYIENGHDMSIIARYLTKAKM